MHRITHSLSCLVVAIALILTGPGATGPAKGDILIEVCSDDTISMLWVDADGNPVGPDGQHAKCLDCLLFSAPLTATTHGLPAVYKRPIVTNRSMLAPIPVRPVAHLRPIPRGPPVVTDGVMRIDAINPDALSNHSSVLHLLDHLQVAAGSGVTGCGSMI